VAFGALLGEKLRVNCPRARAAPVCILDFRADCRLHVSHDRGVIAFNIRTKGDQTVAKTKAKRTKKRVVNAAEVKSKKRRTSSNDEKATSADLLAEARQRVEAERAKLDSAEEAAR